MKKLRMLSLLGATLLLGVAPLAAQNTVDVIGNVPPPPTTGSACTGAVNPNCILANFDASSNSHMGDITTAITPTGVNFYFAGSASTPVTPGAAAGTICVADSRTFTGLFAMEVANCQAGGPGVLAVLIIRNTGVLTEGTIPVFQISESDGNFLESTVGCGSPTSSPCTATNNVSTRKIRINVAVANPSLGGPTKQHNCPTAQAATAYVGPGTTNFTPNESLCLPAGAGQGVEPSLIVDSQGTIYVESIRGVPAGLDLWRWDQSLGPDPDGGPNTSPPNIAGTLPFKYEGQPDCGGTLIPTFCNTSGLAPGGGDGDVATNAPDLANVPNLAVVSLSAAEVTATHSTDRADTFSAITGLLLNPAAARIPGDDRMWIAAYDDPSTVAMNYHDLTTGLIHVQLSTNGGQDYTFGAGGEAIPVTDPAYGAASGLTSSGNIAGQIKIDKNTNSCPSRGNLYQIFSAPDAAPVPACTGSPGVPCPPLETVYVGVSTNAFVHDVPQSTFAFTDHKICSNHTAGFSSCGLLSGTNGTGQVFPALATDNNGFVYAVWSDNTNIYFASSVGSSQGSMWNPAVRVNQNTTNPTVTTVGNANVFPWVAADANGHAVVAWLGADKQGNSNDVAAMEECPDHTKGCRANWHVYAAETVNGNTTDLTGPTFTQYTASDHVIHTGTVSTGGLNPTGTASRSLADFFQVALDPHHHANIAYADDHAGGSGQPYFTRQTSSSAGRIQSATEGSCFIPVNKTCSGGGGGDAEGDGEERGDDGRKGKFKFTAKRACPPSGEMDFDEENDTDGHSGMRGGVDDVTISSGNTAIITGPCTRLDGTACRYAAIVVGNAFPAIGADLFTISWTAADGSFFHTSGILTAGNITVHP
jgi:hypothetical protein